MKLPIAKHTYLYKGVSSDQINLLTSKAHWHFWPQRVTTIPTYLLLDELEALELGLSDGGMAEEGLVIGNSMAVKPKLRPPPLCNNTVLPLLLTTNWGCWLPASTPEAALGTWWSCSWWWCDWSSPTCGWRWWSSAETRNWLFWCWADCLFRFAEVKTSMGLEMSDLDLFPISLLPLLLPSCCFFRDLIRLSITISRAPFWHYSVDDDVLWCRL